MLVKSLLAPTTLTLGVRLPGPPVVVPVSLLAWVPVPVPVLAVDMLAVDMLALVNIELPIRVDSVVLLVPVTDRPLVNAPLPVAAIWLGRRPQAWPLLLI